MRPLAQELAAIQLNYSAIGCEVRPSPQFCHPRRVPDSKVVRLTVHVDYLIEPAASCLKGRGEVSRLEGCSEGGAPGLAASGASFEAATRRLRTRALG